MPDKLYKQIKEIRVEVDKKIHRKILSVSGFENRDNISLYSVKVIFINSIHHFLKGNIHVDELSSIANEYWSDIENKDSELARAIYYCSELSYYVRRIYLPNDETNIGQFSNFMIQIMKYYESNIDLINNGEDKFWGPR